METRIDRPVSCDCRRLSPVLIEWCPEEIDEYDTSQQCRLFAMAGPHRLGAFRKTGIAPRALPCDAPRHGHTAYESRLPRGCASRRRSTHCHVDSRLRRAPAMHAPVRNPAHSRRQARSGCGDRLLLLESRYRQTVPLPQRVHRALCAHTGGRRGIFGVAGHIASHRLSAGRLTGGWGAHISACPPA